MSATKRKAGRPRGRTYPVRLQLTLTSQAAKELREISKTQRLTVNDFVRQSITAAVINSLRAERDRLKELECERAESDLSTASENSESEFLEPNFKCWRCQKKTLKPWHVGEPLCDNCRDLVRQGAE